MIDQASAAIKLAASVNGEWRDSKKILGEAKEAATELQAVVDRAPRSVAALRLLAQARAGTGDTTAALAHLDVAVEASDNALGVIRMRAQLRTLAGLR